MFIFNIGGDCLKDIFVIIILISINAFFAAAEISIISLREVALEKRAMEGDKKAKQLLSIIKEPSKFLATIQVGVTLAAFFTSASAAVGLSKWVGSLLRYSNIYIIKANSNEIAFFVVTVLISFLSLLFGELIPKRVALRKSEIVASKAVGVIRIVEVTLKPLVITLTYFTNHFVSFLFGKENVDENTITEEEIRMMISVGEEKGIFRKTEKEMINSIFQFDNITVGEVMTPRPDMITLDVDSNFEVTINAIIEEKRSRIPVYKDNMDNIVGLLYTKDIIDYMAFKSDDDIFNLKNFIREAHFVTEYKKIDVLLKEMQKRGVHISIVIDEYGSTAGLVTIEDILEKIVGNIYDEYEEFEEEIFIKGENEFEVDGGITMLDLNELLNSKYSDIYNTVSGLILDFLGRFPNEGESIAIEEYIFTILQIDDKRIKRILVKKIV